MRNALNNPFVPGSDTVPPVWAGRLPQLTEWVNVIRPRLIAGLAERGRTILGEPGLGKSSLVRRIAEIAAQDGDWVTRQIRLPVGADPLKAVAGALLEIADRAGLSSSREARISEVINRVRQVALHGVSLTFDRREGDEPYMALTNLLVEIGLAAIREGNAVLIHVDEVQNITDDAAVSQLLISLGDALTYETPVTLPGGERFDRHLPIAVYLTGLPEFAEKASSRTGATFARRFATTTLAPLADDDLMLALATFLSPGWEVSDGASGFIQIHMAPDAAKLIVELCQGEPFLFQLAGQRAWYAGSGSTITRDEVAAGWDAAKLEAAAHVERILERLPEKESQLVHALAELPESQRTATVLARKLGYTKAQNIGPFAQRLDTVRGIIHRGKPYSFRHRALEAYLTTDWPNLG